jgi:cellulose synthase/poly-beta-1,6-N-acetylglucosamine synthase-like glycosyltransferase
MPLLFSVLLTLTAAFYATLLFYAGGGLARLLRDARRAEAGSGDPHDVPEPPLPFVSVIIAARNEEHTIERCLYTILASRYPADLFEVIVVDDASSDRTRDVVRRVASRSQPLALAAVGDDDSAPPPRVRLVAVAGHAWPATSGDLKRALARGIRAARGEIILRTDADCMVPDRWISSMVARLAPETGIVCGMVVFRRRGSILQALQALEYLGIVSAGAGALGRGHPIICNGASLGFRRSAFYESGGFGGIDVATSGDDDLLLQRIAHRTRWRVATCLDAHAVVVTEPAPDVRSFWNQRTRWASTPISYLRPMIVACLVGVYLFYLLLLAALPALAFWPSIWPALAAAMILKLAAEASVLFPACRHLGVTRLLWLFLPAQVIQIPYIVAAPLAALIRRPARGIAR